VGVRKNSLKRAEESCAWLDKERKVPTQTHLLSETRRGMEKGLFKVTTQKRERGKDVETFLIEPLRGLNEKTK